MSDFTTAARPYARAVFEYAQEKKALDQWSEILAFMAAVASEPEIKVIFDSPKLNHSERAEFFLKVCADKQTPTAANLVKLLAENRRLPVIPSIAAQYEEYRALAENQVEATIISAQAVSASEQKRIKAALEKRLGKQITLKTEIDESLIGGAVIKAGDTVIDGSLKARVGKLATQLLS